LGFDLPQSVAWAEHWLAKADMDSGSMVFLQQASAQCQDKGKENI